MACFIDWLPIVITSLCTFSFPSNFCSPLSSTFSHFFLVAFASFSFFPSLPPLFFFPYFSSFTWHGFFPSWRQQRGSRRWRMQDWCVEWSLRCAFVFSRTVHRAVRWEAQWSALFGIRLVGYVQETHDVCSGRLRDTVPRAWIKRWWHWNGHRGTDALCHFTRMAWSYFCCFQEVGYVLHFDDTFKRL